MGYIAILEGIGGEEFFVTPQNGLATAREKAKRFASEKQATEALTAKLATYQPVIQRHTTYRVEVAS